MLLTTLDKVVAATFAEIERLQESGPDATELKEVKTGWIQNHRRSLRENGYWVTNLQSSLKGRTDLTLILNVEQLVGALTAQDFEAVARRYFDTKIMYRWCSMRSYRRKQPVSPGIPVMLGRADERRHRIARLQIDVDLRSR